MPPPTDDAAAAALAPAGPDAALAATPDPAPRREASSVLLTAAAAGAADLLVLWLAVDGLIGLWTALPLHVAVAALAAVPPVARWRRGQPVRFGAVLALSVLAFGPAGAAGTLAAALLHRRFARSRQSFEEWYEALFPDTDDDAATVLSERLRAGREALSGGEALTSFTDIFTFGEREQKQAVIALMARRFQAAFAPALRMALADPDPSVRVQAATACAKIENEIVARWLELSEVIRRDRDDFEAHLALARHLDGYIYLDLMDAQRRTEVLDKAILAYTRCLELRPEDTVLRRELARMLLRHDYVAEAELCLRPLIAGEPSQDALLWYAECLYRLNQLGALRSLIALEAGTERRPASHQVAAVLSLWAGRTIEPRFAAETDTLATLGLAAPIVGTAPAGAAAR